MLLWMALTVFKPLNMKNRKVLVLGASKSPNRYSYLVASKLVDEGYIPILVSNKEGAVAGVSFVNKWPEDIDIDTVTIYLNPSNQSPYVDLLLHAKPKRVIFNPGAENPILYNQLKERRIEVLNACTLVLLSTHQF